MSSSRPSASLPRCCRDCVIRAHGVEVTNAASPRRLQVLNDPSGTQPVRLEQVRKRASIPAGPPTGSRAVTIPKVGP